MKLTKEKLRKMILKEMGIFPKIPKNVNLNIGNAILAYDNSDLIGEAISGIDPKNPKVGGIPTGHGACAIIEANGDVTGVSFGPPLCKKAFIKLEPLMVEFKVNVLKLGNVAKHISSTGRLKESAGDAVIELMLAKRMFRGTKIHYYGYDNVDASQCLTHAGKHGRCKLYTVVPTGVDLGQETDTDNCASFAIDVVAAGKADIGSSLVQVLSSPAAMIPAANLTFGGSQIKGTYST